MIDDALKLTVDMIFLRRRYNAYGQRGEIFYKVPNYADNESMWEFLCDIGVPRKITHTKAGEKKLYKYNEAVNFPQKPECNIPKLCTSTIVEGLSVDNGT